MNQKLRERLAGRTRILLRKTQGDFRIFLCLKRQEKSKKGNWNDNSVGMCRWYCVYSNRDFTGSWYAANGLGRIFYIISLSGWIKKTLGYLGSHSGKNEDKIQATGLTPVFSDGTTYFKEANMVFICRKLYQAPLLEKGYIDKKMNNSG